MWGRTFIYSLCFLLCAVSYSVCLSAADYAIIVKASDYSTVSSGILPLMCGIVVYYLIGLYAFLVFYRSSRAKVSFPGSSSATVDHLFGS